MFSDRFLCQDCLGIVVGSIRPFQDLWEYIQECVLLGTCGSRTVHSLQLEGARTQCRALSVLQGCSQVCFLLRPWTLRTVVDWQTVVMRKLESHTGPFQELQRTETGVSPAWSLCKQKF